MALRDVTLAIALWGAVISTLLAALQIVDRFRQGRTRVEVRAFVIKRPVAGDRVETHVLFEATNLSSRTVSLKQWAMKDCKGVIISGSPYEGMALHGPDLLQPMQLWGWMVTPEVLETLSPPVASTVQLTSGEFFDANLVDW